MVLECRGDCDAFALRERLLDVVVVLGAQPKKGSAQ